MDAVRTPLVGVAFAVAMLLVETLGVRAYIAYAHRPTTHTNSATVGHAIDDIGIPVECMTNPGYSLECL